MSKFCYPRSKTFHAGITFAALSTIHPMTRSANFLLPTTTMILVTYILKVSGRQCWSLDLLLARCFFLFHHRELQRQFRVSGLLRHTPHILSCLLCQYKPGIWPLRLGSIAGTSLPISLKSCSPLQLLLFGVAAS